MLLASLLLLGGCMHTTKTESVQHYTLGSSAPAAEATHHATNHGAKILQITRIAVPSWLAGTAMYYRLAYRDDARLASYAHSDWIAPSATLLEPFIQNAISAGGAWRAVLGPGNPATADVSLRVQLNDFSQTFSQPHDSAGVIDATATLIDNHDEHVIGQQHFHVEVVAPTPDAQGGVKALGEASRQLAADLQRWLRAKCRPAQGA